MLQKLDNGESASTDAEDVLNEGNTISPSAAIQSVETLLDYMEQRGFDYGDLITVTISNKLMDKIRIFNMMVLDTFTKYNAVYSLLSVHGLSGLRIIRAHSGLTKF
ncbi:hypothetical protein AVEN_121959-1 [Araneus ventricosus]|uniref:Uncharacterized protein n=1 Tax=Araneus ventricosus TaxID=182803 RepID=A0A4Y2VN95_ARAVE|nr:hypothetical protein AVEN_18286-1 [Araneus ventricosus]GBO29351.1 hypothetical protein AVEN_121959-1 [Araneus ventricosus]